MQGNQQQAYDRGITIFSPDGRLYQVEYAREAVRRGSGTVGVRTADGVVLAADRQARSSLIERSSIEKIHEIDDHVGIASAGHVADARQLVDLARRQSQVEGLRYDEPIGVESLTKEVTDHIQQYTQTGGARPFGVALLVAGIEDGEARLFETDPSGTPYEWQAVGIGGGADDSQAFLEKHYEEGADLATGIGWALSAIGETTEGGLTPEGLDVATVDVETEQFETMSDDELADHIAEHELGGEADE
jgi:proteasome alpha subunit